MTNSMGIFVKIIKKPFTSIFNRRDSSVIFLAEEFIGAMLAQERESLLWA
ncbi:hypothetical protein LguiA_034625 [Lonicera macranthoides]